MRTKLEHGPVDYQVERHNSEWYDHTARANVTGALLAWMRPRTVLDPACGDASIVRAAHALYPIERVLLADISRPNIDYLARVATELEGHFYCRDATDMLLDLDHRGERFDVIVLTEFLEHIDDPDGLLRLARGLGSALIASSPEMRPGQVDDNLEHRWMFDGEGYYTMLCDAGWRPVQKTFLSFPRYTYDFAVWVCE